MHIYKQMVYMCIYVYIHLLFYVWYIHGKIKITNEDVNEFHS